MEITVQMGTMERQLGKIHIDVGLETIVKKCEDEGDKAKTL